MFPSKDNAMSTAENKEIASRYLTAHAANDHVVLTELLAPDLVAQHAFTSLSRDALLQSIGKYSAAFSDRQFIVKDQIAEGVQVVTRCVWRGIHTGDFQGLPSTGKEISISAFFAKHFKDGKIVELWFLFDQLSMMQQLGLFPPKEKPDV
jgi:steroid delta-isomerase-like uncharacterized protein